VSFVLRITALDPKTLEAHQAEVTITPDPQQNAPTPDLADLTAAALKHLESFPTWPTTAPQ